MLVFRSTFVLQRRRFLIIVCRVMFLRFERSAVTAFGIVACLAAPSLLRAAAGAVEVEAPAVQAPVADAIRGIVDSGRHPFLRHPDFVNRQDTVRRLYEGQAFQPLWARTGRPSSQAAEIIRTLAESDRRGLAPADYDAARLADEAARFDAPTSPSADDIAAFDTALTVSVLRHVSDAHLGRVSPRAIGFSLPAEERPFDPVAIVSELTGAESPAARLAGLDPPFAEFGRLVGALAQWRELAAGPDVPRVADLPKLHPGESHAGVVSLRGFLRATGDLPAGARTPKNARLYDSELVKAVKRFQERHGLSHDGVVGELTLRQLQVSPASRARQIELALERLRWLPEPRDEPYITVNIPEFRLRAFEPGGAQPTLVMNTVVGSAAEHRETPVLTADMSYLVFRPYWEVPPTIAKNEILPAASREPDYLERHRMRREKGRLRQAPGDDNALGLVKFVFPNPHSVYMHDTPSKRFFSRARRDLSHGCVRVADAPGLAEFVLRAQGNWDRARVEAAMRSGRDNRHVTLRRPVRVHLLYNTVTVGEDGATYFFDDIYGHDLRLDTALAKGPPYVYPRPAPVTVEARAEAR